MEHIVQFGINIDDQTIQKRIEENGYNDIIDKLVEEAKNDLPKTWYRGNTIAWQDMVNSRLDLFIAEHRDEVIDAAAEKLLDSYKRTKAFKEKMGKVMEEL